MDTRCPECQTLNSAAEIACRKCGLLFLHKEPPRRRQDDFVRQGRRAADRDLVDCRFCLGKIEGGAVRCRHCGQIVDEDYRREQVKRRRERINYASWVAYVLGLFLLLIFKPAGLIAIGAGLLLSILYYAIPVETLEPIAGESTLSRMRRSVRSQMRLERVSVRMPPFRKAKLVFVGTPVIATAIGYLANFLILQQPMNEILRENRAFDGIAVSAHYEYWIIPGVVVYDLKGLGPETTPLQVHTAFLEYAREMTDRDFDRVVLRWRGTERFELDGSTFHKAGIEYGKRNFSWVLFDLPRLFEPVGVADPGATSEADALMEFHRHWYANDLNPRIAAN